MCWRQTVDPAACERCQSELRAAHETFGGTCVWDLLVGLGVSLPCSVPSCLRSFAVGEAAEAAASLADQTREVCEGVRV